MRRLVVVTLVLTALSVGVAALEEQLGSVDGRLRTAAFLVVLIPIVILLVRSLVRIVKRQGRAASLVGVAFAILLVAADLFAYRVAFEGARAADAGVLRDYVAEAAFIKSLGDDVLAGRAAQAGNHSIATLRARAKKIATALSSVATPTGLSDYKAAAVEWATAIGNAATNKAWRALSDEPAAAYLSGLSTPFAVEYLRSSVERVNTLKVFGDHGIARKDRATLRRIGARILAEKHWLEGLSTSSSSLAAAGATARVQAIGPGATLLESIKGKTRRGPRLKRLVCYPVTGGKLVCANTLANSLGPVWRSALRYSVGEGDARETWDGSWNTIGEQGVPLGGVGITQGQPDNAPWNSFLAQCRASGGTAVSTATKQRLPTTEGGWTCERKRDSGVCWDFLTYSGSRYMGGSEGCPEQGLVPRVAPPPKRAPEDGGWDGTYSIRTTGGGCAYTIGALPIGVNGGTMAVKNNMVDGHIPIDSSGRASYGVSAPISGGSVSVTLVLQFSHQGGGVTVTGNMRAHGSVTYEGQTVSVNCSVSYAGNRVSS